MHETMSTVFSLIHISVITNITSGLDFFIEDLYALQLHCRSTPKIVTLKSLALPSPIFPHLCFVLYT